MKWSQLTPLISPRGMPCHLSLDEIDGLLSEWRDRYGLNIDPDFQRGHVWTEMHQRRYVEFILRLGTPPPLMFNGPGYGGNPVRRSSDLGSEIVLVDGKQRLTAIQKFVDNRLAVFNGYYVNDFEDRDAMLKRVTVTYSVNHLDRRVDVLKWYLEMNEGHIGHTADELDRIRAEIKEKS